MQQELEPDNINHRPQEIDEAARRRLVKRLYIPLPDTPARKHIVLNLMKQQPYDLTSDELDLICNRTEGRSIACNNGKFLIKIKSN